MNKTNGVNYVRFLLVGVGFLCVEGTPVLGETVISDKSDIMKMSITNDSRISGVVVDQTGLPVIGANVSVKGTTNGTITDMDGKFDLEVPAGAQLVVSYIGYITQEFAVGNKTTFQIVLKEDTQNLEEVVVVGYGVQKKVNMTGSVAAINSESLANRPVTNASTALQGMLPGVTVVQNSGQPGKDNSSIRIRGVGTLNNANPMYVVDGLIVSTINDIDPRSEERRVGKD